MDKHYLSANQYQSDMWRLASVIRKSGWKPDFLVGLWRGGAPVAIAVTFTLSQKSFATL